MLHPAEMTKVRMIVPKTQIEKVIQKLHDLQVLHFIQHKKNEELEIAIPLLQAERISHILVKIRALKSMLETDTAITPKKSSQKIQVNLENIEVHTEKIEERLKQYDMQLKETTEKLHSTQNILNQLDILHALYLDLDSYKTCKSLISFIGFINNKNDIRKKLFSITPKYKLHVSTYAQKKLIVIFVEREKQSAVENLLRDYAFQPVEIQQACACSGTILENIGEFHKKIHSLETQKLALNKEREQFKQQEAQFINDAEAYLSIEAEKYFAPLNFGTTKDAYVIQGWMPLENANVVQQELEEIVHNKVFIEKKEIEKKDSVPIILKNPKLMKPFEFFIRLYTLPSYKELDPTTLMFFTFPLFFGLMLGDAGYGLITLILFLWLKKKMPAAKDFMNSLILCSLVTIVFGFLFGEYLGFEHIGEFDFPRVVGRLHGHTHVLGYEIPTVLVIGAIVGFVHINLAFFIGFLNELHHHGFKHAFLAKCSWYVLQVGIALMALSGLHMTTLPLWVGGIVLIAAVVMIYCGENIQGLVELPAIFSNMLSYLRLGAIGLSSVWLAVVINEKLAEPFIHKGGFSIVIAVIILIVGHAINTALGILGPFLHSLRLHYVEFFSKFYHGGGVAYSPFGKNATNNTNNGG